MKKNIGRADRILRMLAGAIIGLLYVTNAVSGIPLAIIALVLIGTSAVGICPLYKVIKVSTVTAGQETNGGTAS